MHALTLDDRVLISIGLRGIADHYRNQENLSIDQELEAERVDRLLVVVQSTDEIVVIDSASGPSFTQVDDLDR